MKNNKKWYNDNVLKSQKYNESKKNSQRKYEEANNYVISRRINIIAVLAIVLIFLIFLIFFYKPKSIDILEEIKSTYIYGITIILGLLVISIILGCLLVKEKKILSNLLKVVLIFNIIFLGMFFYIEYNLNKTYNNEEIFGELYDTQIEDKTDQKYIDIWKSLLELDLNTRTEREVFIDENMSQYTYFRIRVYLVFILYVITIMANTYVISKIDKGIKGQEILEKTDKILFK